MQLAPQEATPRSLALRALGQGFMGSADTWEFDGYWKHLTLVIPQPTGWQCRALDSAYLPALSSDGRWVAWADRPGS